MAVDLEQLKAHLRIDGEDEDDYLIDLLDDVADYVKSLTGIANDNRAPRRHGRAILLCAAHWHGNRSAVGEANIKELPLAFWAIINTLRTGLGLGRIVANGN